MAEGASQSQQRCFTPAQILFGLKQKQPPNTDTKTQNQIQNQYTQNHVVIIDDDDSDNDNDNEATLVEHKPTSVNLAQLLSGNRPSPKPKPEPESFLVTLKIPTPKTQTTTTTTTTTITKAKPYLWVTLKLPRSMQIPKPKPKPTTPTTTSHPFFRNVYQRMSKAEKDKKENSSSSKGQSLSAKLLDLPKLDRHSFKQRNLSSEEQLWLLEHSSPDSSLSDYSLRESAKLNDPTDMDFLLFYSKYRQHQHQHQSQQSNLALCIHTIDEASAHSIISQRYQHLQYDDRFAKFFDTEYCTERTLNTFDQWCDLYSPTSHLENMQKEYISSDISAWFTRSFSMLKRVNEKARRNKLTKKKPPKQNPLDSFIVYSDEETDINGFDQEFDAHVPALIIEGPIGCGKTTMIHSVVVEELGGYVFEFNSSVSRARKDLEFHLRQIGTTSMVPQANNSAYSTENVVPNHDNDKTVILFDDVDLIDNSSNDRDKDFWPGVTNLLSFSYRPVIFITTDISTIPSNIVDEASIYRFERISSADLYSYLDLVALSRGLNIDPSILEGLSHMDLRKALMHLQQFSYRFDLSNVGLNSITAVTDHDSQCTPKPASSPLKELSLLALETDIQHFKNTTQAILETDADSDAEAEAIANYHQLLSARDTYCEFYSSKFFSNGSRARVCRYSDASDYNKRHPANVFVTLPTQQLATDVIPLMHSMAQMERLRAAENRPRRFDAHPDDLDIRDEV